MMKLYKKSDLHISNGYIVADDGVIVEPPNRVIAQANYLDLLLQQANYLKAQPESAPAPSLEGFEPESSFDVGYTVEVRTPVLDKKVADAMEIMNEIDKADQAKHINQDLDGKFYELIQFASSRTVPFTEAVNPVRVDTPVLGNLLELSVDDIVIAIAKVHGVTKFTYDEGEADES